MYDLKVKVIRWVGVFVIIIIFAYGYYITRSVPGSFPVGKNFVVGEGESLRSISLRLEKEHYIYSALLFRTWVSFLGWDRHLQLGEYTFDKKFVLGAVVKKLVSTPDIPLVSVTIPEGSTSYEVAALIKKTLPNFSVDIFGEKVSAKDGDGRLFPSTYFLLPSTTEERLVDMMMETFDKKYNKEFKSTPITKPLSTQEDVIILASILEGEAKTKDDMKVISGILLNRLRAGIALQVDIAKETYNRRGLPAQPVNNPGLVAIDAVFHPTETNYLYYITGKDGTMHYAKTFEEHKRNIQKYLR